MRKFGLVLTAALFAAGLFVACDGDEEMKCSTSRDCAKGSVCQAEKCVDILCNGAADCPDPDGEICVLGDQVGKDPNFKYCTARECSEIDNSLPCPAGQICTGGLCKVDDVTPQDVIEDTTDQDVDRTDTGTDTGPVVDPSLNCKACQSDGDCGAGYKCLPVGTAKFCLQNCDGANDCPAGYLCYQGSSVSKNCLPVSYNCVECAHDVPCEAGQCCDFVSGQCKACKAECESCTYDFDCEAGSRCLKEGSSPMGVCVAGCKGGASCPDGFTCGANTAGIEVCQPNNPDDCKGCPAGQYLKGDGNCVECLNSSHCENGEICDDITNRCLGECGKKFKCSDNACHDCCEDTDCRDSLGNDTGPCTDYACVNAVDECGGTCEGQFPICAVINGIPQCVECETAADCPVASCICTGDPLYSCVFEDGSVCASSCAASCSSDADCPPGTNGAMLNCHLGSGASGICYDPGGSCDMYTACCAPGQSCFDFLSILFGGMGGGMPGMPGGGLPPTGMAACSCNDQNPCLGGTACTSTSFICLLEMLIPGICPNGQPPSTMPSSLCIDLMKLLGGLFSP
jgi:hypothetical protein